MQNGNVHEIEVSSNEWVTSYEWIGIVYPQDSHPGSDLITPLAYHDDQWCEFSEEECQQSFPNNGKVVYFFKNSYSLNTHLLYQFYPKKNVKLPAPDDAHRSQYVVFEPSECKLLGHILNWTSSLQHIFDLPILLERGIPIDDCWSRCIYIRYGEYAYGPIYLETNGDHLFPREYLAAKLSLSGGQPLYLKKYLFSELTTIKLAGQLFVDPQCLTSPRGEIDCSLPQVTVKAALKAYKQVAERAEKELLVDKYINALSALHSSKNIDAPTVEDCTLKRAQDIVRSRMNMLDDLQDIFSALPNDHALLRRARDYEIQQRKSEIDAGVQQQREKVVQEFQHNKAVLELEFQQKKSTLEQEFRRCKVDAQDRLQLLQSQVDSVAQQLAANSTELENVAQKMEQAQEQAKREQAELEIFEQYMHERLDQLRQEPLRLLADLHITSTLQQAIAAPFMQVHPVVPPIKPSTVLENPADTQSIVERPLPITNQSLRITPQPQFFTERSFDQPPAFNFFLKAAKQSGAPSQSVKTSAASLLAGLVPAMYGPPALCTLQAVAQTIAGNQLWSIQVPLTALSPLDLIGTISSTSQRLIPTGDLADILLEAQANPQQLGIILLEGIDRVPFLPVLAPFFQHYRAVRQQKQHTTTLSIQPLRLFHPLAITSDDPYRSLASFCWPANLLLAATLDYSPGSFVLPESYASWFTFPEMIEREENSVEQQTIYQIKADNWYAREQENVHNVSGFSDAELLDILPWEWKTLKSWQKMFVTAALEMKIPKDSLPAVIEKLWPDVGGDEHE